MRRPPAGDASQTRYRSTYAWPVPTSAGAPRAAHRGLPRGARLHPLPAAREHAHAGRLRRRQRRRGPHVRRRGAGREGGRERDPVRRGGGQAARRAARRRSASRAPTSSSRTCSCAALRATATRCPARSTTARSTSCARSSSSQPRVICTLGNFATKLLRGDPTGISRLHGQAEIVIGRQPRGAAVSALSPGGRALHARAARHAARRRRAPAGAARDGPAGAARAAPRRSSPRCRSREVAAEPERPDWAAREEPNPQLGLFD